MNRRDLLKRTFGVAATGLLLPTLEHVEAATEILIPERRYWPLDKTMLRPRGFFVGRSPEAGFYFTLFDNDGFHCSPVALGDGRWFDAATGTMIPIHSAPMPDGAWAIAIPGRSPIPVWSGGVVLTNYKTLVQSTGIESEGTIATIHRTYTMPTRW